jgi:hypothetical protein
MTTAETFINISTLIKKKSFLFFEHQIKCETKKVIFMYGLFLWGGRRNGWVGYVRGGQMWLLFVT